MSAPDVNVEKQKKRHLPALWGVWISGGIVALAGGIAAFYFLI